MAFWRPGAEKPDVPVDKDLREAGIAVTVNQLAGAPVDVQRRSLPIFAHRKEILFALEMYGVLVIIGETGSGKSTQILQYLHESGWTAGGRIVCCTQPRRVAAVTLATRVAEEMSTTLGQEVGYAVRFNDKTSDRTVIKYVTDGILLRELLVDPLLSKYSVIMLDEAHERSLYTDLLAGLLKKIRRRRPDLRLIVSSATMDASKFRDFFDLHLDDKLIRMPTVDVTLPDVPNRPPNVPAQIFQQSEMMAADPEPAQTTASSAPANVAEEIVLAGVDSDTEAALENLLTQYGQADSINPPAAAEKKHDVLDDSHKHRSRHRHRRSESPSQHSDTRRDRRERRRSDRDRRSRSGSRKHKKHRKHRRRERSRDRRRHRSRSRSTRASSRSASPTPDISREAPISRVSRFSDAVAPAQSNQQTAPPKPLPKVAVVEAPTTTISVVPTSSSTASLPPVLAPTEPDLAAACVVCIEGRTHPVELHYANHAVRDFVEAAADTVLFIHLHRGQGDILVFLPGKEEIDDCCERIQERLTAALGLEGGQKMPPEHELIITPLYAQLPWEQQLAALEPSPARRNMPPARKVVVATNIAETSVTIPDVVFVVDCGYSKLAVYDPIAGIDTLLTLPVSKAAAIQRAGRAGRVRPGQCYRLYTEQAFTELSSRTVPELLRCEITPIVLQMLALGVDKIAHFDFLDAPMPAALIRAFELLHALKAVGDDGKLLNPHGFAMADLPVDPRNAAMLLASLNQGCAELAITVAAANQVQDIYVGWRGGSKKTQAETADEVMKEFAVTEGDALTVINVYRAFEASGRSVAWCREHLFDHRALMKIAELRQQLRRALVALAKRETSHNPACTWSIDTSYEVQNDASGETLRKCILQGYFTNVAQLDTHTQSYRLLRSGKHALLHPQSIFHRFGRKPEWVVFTDAVKTSTLYIRDITPIHPRWLIELLPHYFRFFGTEHGTETTMAMDVPKPPPIPEPIQPPKITYRPKSERTTLASTTAAATSMQPTGVVRAGAASTTKPANTKAATRGLASFVNALFDDDL